MTPDEKKPRTRTPRLLSDAQLGHVRGGDETFDPDLTGDPGDSSEYGGYIRVKKLTS